MTTPIQGIIFDIDGTLVDSVGFHAQAWERAFKKHGYEVPYLEVKKHIGKGGEYIVESFVPENEVEQVVDAISSDRKSYYQSELLPKVKPFPEVKALFHRLRADGIRIVLASSGRPDSVKHYIDMLDIGSLIENATSTEDVEHSKPEPDIFEAALEKLSPLKKKQVLVVGDSPYDAEAASRIGLTTIGVLCGGFPEQRLRDAGCSAVYQDPADLLNHYSEWLPALVA